MRLEDLKTHEPRTIGEDSLRQASVLIPLIKKENAYHLLFQVRSAALQDQPGDICFPGGGREGSETPEETAVRETCEELLIRGEQIRLLGRSDQYVQRGIIIHAVVGELEEYRNTFSEDEVGEIFTVPLSFFLNTEPDRYEIKAERQFPEDFPFDKIYGGKNYEWYPVTEEVLFWEYENHVIWGITARILSGFVSLLKSQ